jgi:hypothetical protein
MHARPLSVLPLLAIAALGGCSRGPEARLQGKWSGERIDNVPAEALARATGWVKETQLAFTGNKLTVKIPAEEPRTGTYEVARADANALALRVTRPDGQVDDATFVVEGDGTLRWRIGDEREIVLVRTR